MDRQATAPAPAPAVTAQPRDGLYLGPIHITLALVVVALALVGSAAYIAWVVLEVDEGQLELLAYGFVVLGASFAAIAVGSLVGMWRAASRARGGRALILAIVGGLAALAAIGCFTVSVVSALVWTS
jgi:hypothetical protein